MTTVFIVLVESDGSFIGVFEHEKDANKKAESYKNSHDDPCEVFEELLE